MRRFLMLVVFVAVARAASAWNVACVGPGNEKCPDGYAKVRTPWTADPQSEHRRLFERTLEVGGLPASLRDTFILDVHSDGAPVFGEEGRSYKSIRPVRSGARHIEHRELTVQAMSNLPDNSYTLWDWASGNELCPPDPGNADARDCHDYETHIGWLNSNHMLPQSRRFYEHLHRLALDRADECRVLHDTIDEDDRGRLMPFLLACEKEALVIEAVGHHYLQDSWSMGHMWERWGGPEVADFGNDRVLGFAIAAFTGTIHGAGAMIPGDIADDPMCAPHDHDNYVDDPNGVPREHPGVGDVYLEEFLLAPGPWEPQRRALLGCAVDGVRAVYAATAQVHGPMLEADGSEIDGSRSVGDIGCWRQRATNKAIATGCGIHFGGYPHQQELLNTLLVPGVILGGAALSPLLPLALADVVANVLDVPSPLPAPTAVRFARDAAYTCTLAAAYGLTPGLSQATNLAEGRLPSLVGIRPNSSYARGDAAATPPIPPASYADPALPWRLDAATLPFEKEALNLTFADAHAADRCSAFQVADLEVYPAEVARAQEAGDLDVIEARCSQCAQLVAPHLRFGVEGMHDTAREPLCAFTNTFTTGFLYTGDEPSTFPGAPADLDTVRAAARRRCGCDCPAAPAGTAGPPTCGTTTTTLPTDGHVFSGVITGTWVTTCPGDPANGIPPFVADTRSIDVALTLTFDDTSLDPEATASGTASVVRTCAAAQTDATITGADVDQNGLKELFVEEDICVDEDCEGPGEPVCQHHSGAVTDGSGSLYFDLLSLRYPPSRVPFSPLTSESMDFALSIDNNQPGQCRQQIQRQGVLTRQ